MLLGTTLPTLWVRALAASSRGCASFFACHSQISGRCVGSSSNITTRSRCIPLPHRYSVAYLSSSSISDDIPDTSTVAQIINPGSSIKTALHYAVQALERKSVPEPEESVLHLLSHSLGLSWESGHRELREVLRLPTMPDAIIETSSPSPLQTLARQPMSKDQCNTFQALLERRIQLEPLQYIVGQWDFHNLVGLEIKKPMLCPRPETEELVEYVLEEVSQLIQRRDSSNKDRIRILDVGCGTGAIGLAIANRYHDVVQVVALDVLPEAVNLSNNNAKKFLSEYIGEEEENKLSSIYKAILCSADDFTNTQKEQSYKMDFDIVVSNPPYIPSKDMDMLSKDVVGYESDRALCGGEDGLDIIRHIVHRLPEWTNGNCWLEVDDSHPSLISDWLSSGSEESKRLGVECVETYNDFCGRDRFVKLRVL